MSAAEELERAYAQCSSEWLAKRLAKVEQRANDLGEEVGRLTAELEQERRAKR